MWRAFLSAALALAVAAPAGTQTPAASGRARFESAVDVVTVDVVVLDKRGEPVAGLKAEDFEIKEEGQPQKIESFDAVAVKESASVAAQGRQRRIDTNTRPAQPSGRWFVIVIDDVNLSQHATPRARDAVTEFVTAGLTNGDQVMVVPTSGGAWWTGRVPEDRESLVAFIGRQQGALRPETSAGRIWDHEAMAISLDRDPQALAQVARRYFENRLISDAAYPIDREVRRELDVSPGLALIRAKAREVYSSAASRLRATLAILDRVSAALAAMRGHKTLLLVSEGFVMDPSQSEFRSLLRTARQANAAVHFIDARSPEGFLGQAGMPGGGAEFGDAVEERDTTTALAFAAREAEGARSVAIDTGGTIVSGTRLPQAMAKIARASTAYYLLGYTPTRTDRDGKFRKIEVRVARPDVEVRARRGYYAPSDKEVRPPDPDKLEPAVRAGLDAPDGTPGIPLRLTSYVSAQPAKGPRPVLLVAEADVRPLGLAARGDRYEAILDSYVVVHARDTGGVEKQETRVELALPKAVFEQLGDKGVPIRRSFTLAPGRYQARLLVRHKESGRLGSVRHEFEVPETDELRASTPVLTDTFQAGAGGAPQIIPLARRFFAAGSKLACAFDVGGAAPDAAAGGPRVSVAYRLVGADGRERAASPPQNLRSQSPASVSAVIGLTLPKDAQGEHQLIVTVRDEVSTRTLEIVEPFEVRPAS